MASDGMGLTSRQPVSGWVRTSAAGAWAGRRPVGGWLARGDAGQRGGGQVVMFSAWGTAPEMWADAALCQLR